ncbi:MAG: methyltransferase domain-containing protein [Vicinamibacterales bacterium]
MSKSKKFWDAHAERDPLWAVLSDQGKEDRNWNVQRFFDTGVNEIAEILYQLNVRDISATPGRALDFGCGVGRLTQALALHFPEVVGVDISSQMIKMAISLNRYPKAASFVCNQAPHLGIFGDEYFDFIYSNLVLQHIAPELTLVYVREFFRVLRPGGLLIFQSPSHLREDEESCREAQQAKSMVDDAYDAALSVSDIPTHSLQPGTTCALTVDVTNKSAHAWSQPDCGAISIGNHWLDETATRMLLRDDGRATLPTVLGPGETCRLPLSITAPAREGNYCCEIDVAHEGVRWFKDRGSSVARFQARVRAASSSFQPEEVSPMTPESQPTVCQTSHAERDLPSQAPGKGSGSEIADFPMYGVHTDTVSRLILSCGGELVLRSDDYSCAGWVSYRYFVRKNPSSVEAI